MDTRVADSWLGVNGLHCGCRDKGFSFRFMT